MQATWEAPPEAGMRGEIRRVVDSVVLYHLMVLQKDESAFDASQGDCGTRIG